jgi:dynein heavy chain
MTTIKSSIYVGPIKTAVEDWDRRLTLFSKTLDEWIICQKKWLYLKQIFSAPDIQRQLVSESKIFNSVEKFWKDLMRRTDDKPNAVIRFAICKKN